MLQYAGAVVLAFQSLCMFFNYKLLFFIIFKSGIFISHPMLLYCFVGEMVMLGFFI